MGRFSSSFWAETLMLLIVSLRVRTMWFNELQCSSNFFPNSSVKFRPSSSKFISSRNNFFGSRYLSLVDLYEDKFFKLMLSNSWTLSQQAILSSAHKLSRIFSEDYFFNFIPSIFCIFWSMSSEHHKIFGTQLHRWVAPRGAKTEKIVKKYDLDFSNNKIRASLRPTPVLSFFEKTEFRAILPPPPIRNRVKMHQNMVDCLWLNVSVRIT